MTLEVPIDSWNVNPERLLKQAYTANLDWCVSYVIKNNGSTVDAEDVFQESICIAWLNLTEGKFQGDSEQFNAYIRQICKYKWINQLRSYANNKIILKEDLSDFEGKIDLNSVEEDAGQVDLLQNSFSSIGEKCQDLLSRFYFQRETLASLAKLMEFTKVACSPASFNL